jgi:amino acid adenylation domain-containing protein
LFEFSRWAIVAALAVLTVGGVCLHLDHSHPRARHEKLLELTKAQSLLCSADLAQMAHGLVPCVITVSAETVSKSTTSRHQTDDSDTSEQNAYLIFTSGSTGTPKGSVLQHRALATSLMSIGCFLGLHRECRVLQATSYVWDVSLAEIFGTLIFGGCVCIPSTKTRESGLADYINALDVEVVFQTPTVLRNLSPDEIPKVKTVVSGGERVRPEAAITWGSRLRLVNGYGPCEASIFVSLAELSPQAKYPETIGKPVGCAIWIADPVNPARLVPIGAVGELLIEDATVAKGYYCNDDATTAVFIETPAWAPRRLPALTKARRFYRTGDLGRYNEDGSIFFIGRQDHQVKVRGQRLELGEIEAVITQCSTVRMVAVVTHVHRSRNQVVAVLAIDNLPRGKTLTKHSEEHSDTVAKFVNTVRTLTTTKLPSYMVPTHWLVVQDLPRSVSNKVDRQAIVHWLSNNEQLLSCTLDADDNQKVSISPPNSAAEKTLCSVWSNVLDIPELQIGRESSFLRLGGDSITAMQVATRMRRLGLQLSVQTLMQQSTLSDTAAQCKETLPPGVPNVTQGGRIGEDVPARDSVSDLDVDVVKQRIGDLDVAASNVEAIYPCSAIQEGILFAQLKGESDGYRDRFTLRIRPTDPSDTISVQDLERAWCSVCNAHPILRTVFASGIDDVHAFQQIVLRETEPMVLHKLLDDDLDILSFLHDHAKPSFPETTPPHCLTVVQGESGPSKYMVFDISHALIDTRTIVIIAEQLISAYQRSSQIPRGPNFRNYIDWAHAQRDESSQFWLSHLSKQKPCLLPTEDVPQAARPSRLQVTAPYDNAAELIEFCKLHGVTVASFVQVVWALVLKRYSVEADVTPCFGCLHSGRHVIQEAEQTMGPLLTMLISSIDTSAAEVTPIELMNQARLDSVHGSDKAGCSLSEIHEQLGLGAVPLFNTLMSINPSLHATIDLSATQGNISVEFMQVDNPTEVRLPSSTTNPDFNNSDMRFFTSTPSPLSLLLPRIASTSSLYASQN